MYFFTTVLWTGDVRGSIVVIGLTGSSASPDGMHRRPSTTMADNVSTLLPSTCYYVFGTLWPIGFTALGAK